MNLFERDFCQLTEEEIQEKNRIDEKAKIKTYGDIAIKRNVYFEYPKAIRHNISLFPNNFLDPKDLCDREVLTQSIDGLERILGQKDCDERPILNYIRDNRAYFIVGSILKMYFHFGHHGAFLFPEFQLGTAYKADYLLVGDSSDGFHFVFVEFESPSGNVTLSEGGFGEVSRKGFSQIDDWDSWIEANYQTLADVFLRSIKSGDTLPDEFYRLDKSRISYVVVVGRRSDFKAKTYRRKRLLNRDSIKLIHYDNLIEDAGQMIGLPSY